MTPPLRLGHLKIRQMSQGDGHPENVPAHGTQGYRQP
jgi:hypothetical protein